MTIHICKCCDYTTIYTTAYKKHKETLKHKNNMKNKGDDNINVNIMEQVTKKDINIIMLQNEELKKKIELLEKSNQELKEVSNENTHKIVKEARVIKKSILSMLNSDYKDTPSIDYIKEDKFREEFEEEYNLKLSDKDKDKDNKLFMRIFSDYKKRKLIGSICNVIVRIIKKEDQKQQSVFNIDAARGNYATKIQDIWHNDKKGLQLKKYTIDVVTKYMLNIMDIYRMKLLDMYNENKIKKDINVTDFIMEKQGLLLDVNAFLTSPITHKRIILNMCPELRMEDRMIE
jgi:hypothetical protein